ncbi:MAG: sugar nucleotide-binding protein [Planctomycetaceae bacterium]|nr:sugar nucleotide-binding protein [Planctomycetaceae bacterium]
MHPPWLVIGGDSMIGAAIVARLREQGRRILATTRRRDALGDELRHLELAAPQPFAIPWNEPFVALVAAGQTSLQACHDHPDQTWMVNVAAIKQVAAWLRSCGGFVVFLSTNLVFDGQLAARSEDDPTCPNSEYGRQKRDAEEFLLQNGPAAIVRLTKVFGPRPQLLQKWHAALRTGQSISAFTDLNCAPMLLADVAPAVQCIGDRHAEGIWHLSGSRDISYLQMARVALDVWRHSADRIRICTAADQGILAPHRCRYTALNTSKARRELGWAPRDADLVLRDLACSVQSE